jgi:hypothetical protein
MVVPQDGSACWSLLTPKVFDCTVKLGVVLLEVHLVTSIFALGVGLDRAAKVVE